MSDEGELAAVLRGLAELVGRDDVDTTWSSYEPDELRSEIGSLLRRQKPVCRLTKQNAVTSGISLH